MKTLAELLALSTDEMSVEELRSHLAAIAEAAEAVAAGDLDDAALELLGQAGDAAEAIGTAIAAAEAADAEAASAAQAAVDRIKSQLGPDDGGDDGEGADGEGDGDDDAGEGDDSTEGGDDEGGEGDEGGDTTDVDGSADGADADAEGDTPDALAASRGTTPRVSNVNARRPKQALPKPKARNLDGARLSLVASANAPGVAAGAVLDTPEKIAHVFEKAIKAGLGYKGNEETLVPLVHATVDFPEEFTLSEDAKVNDALFSRIREGVRREGSLARLAAASGACAPYDVMYDQPFIGSDGRPVRDNLLNRVGVPRGGVTVLPTVRYTQLNGAVDFWDDEAGHVVGDAEQTTKPIIEVDCEEPYDAETYEVTERVRFGTIKARYFPERIQAIMKALAVAQARKADTKLLQLLGSSSTPDGGALQLTSGQLIGATRDLLTTLDRCLAAFRSSYRLDRRTPLAFGHPDWLFDMLRADLAREAPGSADERLATADAKIAQLIQARNVVPKPFMDGESGQVFNFQQDGPVQGWPSQVVTYLYPDGDAHFLDGGRIDFGIVRDSGLIAINKYEMFAETTEGFLYHSSVDRMRLALDLCPDGTTSGPKELTGICSTGS